VVANGCSRRIKRAIRPAGCRRWPTATGEPSADHEQAASLPPSLQPF
jgi:hypothetical protein